MRVPGTTLGRFALLAPLGAVVVALLVGGVFVAHLAVDSYACMSGVRSAC